ncbi:MAG: zinc-dependent peptidase [Burkholderiales bacterium]|nr:zinc-dependent peptidase [Burkholderiales bacterium]
MAETLLIVLALAAIAWPLVGPVHRRWRRARLDRQPFPPAWRAILRRRVPLLRRLPADLRLQLQRHIVRFVAEVPFIGCAGQQVDDEVRVTIAAQACLLLLQRGGGFEGLREVLVYPGAFAVERVHAGAGGVQHEQRSALAGESHGRGAVVLSWQDALDGAADPDDGRNVVIHEFAHRLDQDNGAANGAPWLGPGRGYDEWARVMAAEYAALRMRVAAGESSAGIEGEGGEGAEGGEGLIPAYGATDPAEFFAVVSELYFERPAALKREHAALYAQLRQVYRTDPSLWQ